jgi:hypothetical protein
VIRAVRSFPQLLDAIAEGRLHLTGVNLLAPHLTSENATDLVTAATHRTCADIRKLLAERERRTQPTDDLLEQVVANTRCEPDLNQVGDACVEAVEPSALAASPAPPAQDAPPAPRKRRLTIELTDEEWATLEYAMSLDSHVVKPRDWSALVVRALGSHVDAGEKRRFAPSSRSRGNNREAVGRHVSLRVRREVWQRDGGCCTFTSDTGRRCESRDRLEFDHVEMVARGGFGTAANLRLRCRAHNQFEAERALGQGFMEAKRAQAKVRAAERRERRATAAAGGTPQANVVALREREADHDVRLCLKSLGFSATEIREAAGRCAAAIPEASVEEKVRYALKSLVPRGRHPAA